MTSPPIPPKPRRTAADRRAVVANRKARQRDAQRSAGLVTITGAVQTDTAAKLKELAAERRTTLGEAIDDCLRTAEAAERKIRWREKAAAEGRQAIFLLLKTESAVRLRRLAKRDGSTQASVVEMGLYLLANKELMRDVREWAAARRAAKAAAEQAQ